MQVQRSYQSFAEGGFNGVGPGNGAVKHNLPDAHADFIFSVMAEEYGLITCLFVILIYLAIVLRNFAKCYGAQDMFSILAISGLTVQFSLQTFINMASSMSLIPTKGMTLPFISYGGSSLITSCITIGLIVALTRSQSISFALCPPMPTGEHHDTSCMAGIWRNRRVCIPRPQPCRCAWRQRDDIRMLTDRRGSRLIESHRPYTALPAGSPFAGSVLRRLFAVAKLAIGGVVILAR